MLRGILGVQLSVIYIITHHYKANEYVNIEIAACKRLRQIAADMVVHIPEAITIKGELCERCDVFDILYPLVQNNLCYGR